MTEADTKTQESNGAAATESGDVSSEVLRQLDYYFGDFNLPKDKFLKNAIEEAKEGWISLDVMLKFQRLANLTKDKELIIKALEKSDILETNKEKLEVRRKPSLPIPVSVLHKALKCIFNSKLSQQRFCKFVTNGRAY